MIEQNIERNQPRMIMSSTSRKGKHRCPHFHRRFIRMPFDRKDGVQDEHVREECELCGQNCRVPGVLVGCAELFRLGIAPPSLPVQKQSRTPSLFDAEEGGA
jgi:hypothetical protein